MESKVNYTIVGIFVLAFFAIIIFIALWLSTGVNGKRYKIYQVYMNESVAGLSENAPVKYNGVNVGFVSHIELNLKNPRQVIITLKIEEGTPVTTHTEAILAAQGITGIAYIGLRGGGEAPPLEAAPGRPYPVITAAPSFFMRLDTTLQSLTKNIDDLTTHMQSLLDEQNLQAFQATLQNIKDISGTIAANDKNIDQSLHDMRVIMRNTANASHDFPEVMRQMKTSLRSVQDLTKQFRITVQTMTKTFQQSNNAINAISNQLVPETYTTLENIQDVTNNLRGFTKELNENPAILLRGKTPPPPGPGE